MAAIPNVNAAPLRAIQQHNPNDSCLKRSAAKIIAALVVAAVAGIFYLLGLPTVAIFGFVAGAGLVLVGAANEELSPLQSATIAAMQYQLQN